MTGYTSATTAEMTATLNKELQLVSECVARNKLALNISKTKSIVFRTKPSLNPKPQLNIVINNVEIEQVKMTKLLGETLDCKLSWSKHIDAVVAKMGRSLSIIKHCSAFITTLSTRQVLQALVSTFITTLSTRQVLQVLVLSHLDYGSVVWSGATKKDFRKLQLAQNRAAQLALGCTQRANINNMHVNLSWLKVEERLTSSLLLFMRGIDMLNALSCLSKLLAYSSDTHAYPSRHSRRGLFTVLMYRTDYGRCTVLHRAMTTWNIIPHQVAHASSKIRF